MAAEEIRRRAPYLALESFIEPGADAFQAEKAAAEIVDGLGKALESLELPLSGTVRGSSPFPSRYQALAPDLEEAVYDATDHAIAQGWHHWIESLGTIRRAQFFPLPGGIVRYEVASEKNGKLLYRVGRWRQTWSGRTIVEFSPLEEHVASAGKPYFRDVTAHAFQGVPSFVEQLSRGIPYWRSRLDPATGIDIYGSNGIAVGDIDNDGLDEIYVCQPGGLPNRLYKFDGDGLLADVTDAWHVGMLDDSSCALFLDLRNSGRQDLVVLRANGPVLFLNEGGRFSLRTDAFRFANSPKGGFTGMAAADFDRDGKLDLYLCCYVYFQSEAQYTYAAPYHDAQNGPPNFLFRNKLNPDGTGFLDDCTAQTGIDENNNRFSFAPAWCDFNDDGWPDLYVANDFGRNSFYINEEGRFRDMAASAGVEDIGPGMSACWFDYNRDGKADLYVGNMWTDAGQRVVRDSEFVPTHGGGLQGTYERHTAGNSLFHNRGDNTLEDVTSRENVAFGRWAWACGGHDLNNDGEPEIFVTCGMLTNTSRTDLCSFFWRQVVNCSPVSAGRSPAYENGWNAINQFIREEYSWNGYEPNVLHVRRGDRYFDFSGISGLDFAEDSRAFAMTDFDGDGRPDIVLKSRLGPQVRVLQNDCAATNRAIVFQLQGTKSNRDAIGARIQADGQTKWLEAGSGFLSQHTKQVVFGLGQSEKVRLVRVTWPSGLVQEFRDLVPGNRHFLIEGSAEVRSQPLRPHRELPSRQVLARNDLALQDTWFLEPVPLPEPQTGPRVFVLDGSGIRTGNRDQYEIFRRYLFDWRTQLKPPVAFLLDESGHAVKVYAEAPSSEQVRADLPQLSNHARHALPFPGFYVDPPHRDFFKFGAAFLWAGCYEQALPYLQAVLRRTPDNARVLVLVGQIHWEANRFEAAESAFGQALDANPDSVPALLGLGDVAARLNRYGEAEQRYRRALEFDGKSAEAANGLGLMLGKQGDFEHARHYMQEAISLRPDYAQAINNLGVLYTQHGKTDDALAAFDYGVRKAPDEDILYLNLGRLYARLGKLEKARQVMQQLLDRKPQNAIARQALEELSGR
ncbi:MAG: FG-GAP-like repeat-containing protein [Bryobacteraceae bacterium]